MRFIPPAEPGYFDLLGNDADAIVLAVQRGLQSGHLRSLDAQDASQLRTKDPYGATYWLASQEEVAMELGRIGAEVFRPWRGRYDLAKVGTTLVLPIKYSSDLTVDIDQARIRPSKFRHDLFKIPQRASEQTELDFSGLGAEYAARGIREPRGSYRGATRVLVFAHVCNPRSGLLKMYVGEASLRDDGTLDWAYRDEVAIAMDLFAARPAQLQLTGTGVEAPSFADAPLAEPDMTLRANVVEEPAVEDEQTDNEDGASANGADE